MVDVGFAGASPTPEESLIGGLLVSSLPLALNPFTQLSKNVITQNPEVVGAAQSASSMEVSSNYELNRMFDEVRVKALFLKGHSSSFPGEKVSNDKEDDNFSMDIIVCPEVSSRSEKASFHPSPELVTIEEELHVTDIVSILVLSSGIENFDWVLRLVSFVRQMVGTSCEGHDEKLMSLFASLKREIFQNG